VSATPPVWPLQRVAHAPPPANFDSSRSNIVFFNILSWVLISSSFNTCGRLSISGNSSSSGNSARPEKNRRTAYFIFRIHRPPITVSSLEFLKDIERFHSCQIEEQPTRSSSTANTAYASSTPACRAEAARWVLIVHIFCHGSCSDPACSGPCKNVSIRLHATRIIRS